MISAPGSGAAWRPGLTKPLPFRERTTLTAVWAGDLGLSAALSTEGIVLEGPRQLVRSFPKRFGLHPLFAGVEHPASRPWMTASPNA
jgi:hypothetical protein